MSGSALTEKGSKVRMIEKGQRLHPGDILRNDWASETNPALYTMYIKRGKVGHCATIDCLAYDGRMIHHGEKNWTKLILLKKPKRKAANASQNLDNILTVIGTKSKWIK